ncbi:21 kDa protein-like [Melia azedarach]|uniref:21 kDa protein-like n=1 Tax=Melia azedarach TaxID=155640 RepID=A0ACC1XQ19_MELAZ|nr:21 kDa protein-like [Melia azedarach]
MKGSYFSPALTVLILLIQFDGYKNSYCSAARPTSNETIPQFIKTSCGVTTYPDLCFTTLSSYATKIQANPKLLATTALSVTLKATRSTSTVMKKLSNSQGLTPREAAALYDCVEELGDSVDELQKSISEMGHNEGKNLALQMNNIQTWVSAALTDEDTCMDGFSGNSMNGNLKSTVRSQIVNVAHLTSNALALINNYASIALPH